MSQQPYDPLPPQFLPQAAPPRSGKGWIWVIVIGLVVIVLVAAGGCVGVCLGLPLLQKYRQDLRRVEEFRTGNEVAAVAVRNGAGMQGN